MDACPEQHAMRLMENKADVREVSVLELLDAIGSSRPSSGAGIAAAMALSLGAACALKAVNVTLKHAADAKLTGCGERLKQHRDQALDRARIDTILFEKYLQDGEPRDAAMLVKAAQEFQLLAAELGDELEGLEERVRASVVADVTSARLLHTAAVEIEALILRDNRELRARTMP
jgi:formiminotetrahydrofolate cyclodeaminase